MVVDTYVNEFPTGTASLGLAMAITGDTMVHAVELAQLLDIDVYPLAGRGALIANHRPLRFQVPPAVETVALENTPCRRPRNTGLFEDLIERSSLPAQFNNPRSIAAQVRVGLWKGREERSLSPARPSWRCRLRHL